MPLPEDLRVVLHRFASGNLLFDAMQLLETMPRWQDIKQRTEQNNHRSDGSKATYKLLKQTQQKLLSLQRIYPLIHSELKPDSEGSPLSQQMWACLAFGFGNVFVDKKEKDGVIKQCATNRSTVVHSG